ncbi:Dehydrogenase (Polyethylene glycol dehydrogenase, alcoholdehydrogenase, L-sorbose dehydrogenase) [Balamuthia mandrillaris]
MAAALGVGMSLRTHADFNSAQAPYDQVVSDETDMWEERWKELNVKLAALAKKIEALVESSKIGTRMAQEDVAAIVSGGARRVPRGRQPIVVALFELFRAPTCYHMVGSCKMGANNDAQAVVDSEFRVFGVDNLRVVDCSVTPVVVPTHPSASATMLAERCAALIKEEYAN